MIRSDEPDLVFDPRTRWALALGAALLGTAVVVASGFAGDSLDAYIGAHAAGAGPFLVGAGLLSRRARDAGPPEYRRFWHLWSLACLCGVGASLAAAAGVLTGIEAFLLLDGVLILAAAPLWMSAIVHMARANAGRRSVSVDLVNALTALVVLGAPVVVAVAAPVVGAERPELAVPFALAVVLAPALLYLAFLNLSRIPRGARAAQGLGAVLAALFAANTTLQLGHVEGGIEAPLPVFVGVHTASMVVGMALPLWAHRRNTSRLSRLPVEHQARLADPLPYVTAAVLPALALWVALTWEDARWQVPYLIGVLVAVVLLHAVRHSAQAREARRLHAEVTRLSDERRRLLANMLRALEDDRRRTATELHTQAVGSLATLGSIVQTASVGLPAASATAVRQTIAQLQADLGGRAEELRRLMVAMRPPELAAASQAEAGASAGAGGGSGGGPAPGPAASAWSPAGPPSPEGDQASLAAALLAYASELDGAGPGPEVRVEVDPVLRLDWATMTVVYRIAQEGLLNAVRHGRPRSVDVRVWPHGGGVAVEVRDDGAGFEPERAGRRSGLATMELFAHLGRGELAVVSAPGAGTVVRAVLGTRPDTPASPGPRSAVPPVPTPAPVPGRRHLRSVPRPDETGSGQSPRRD